jgi:hypothetical protein
MAAILTGAVIGLLALVWIVAGPVRQRLSESPDSAVGSA